MLTSYILIALRGNQKVPMKKQPKTYMLNPLVVEYIEKQSHINDVSQSHFLNRALLKLFKLGNSAKQK